MRNNMNIYDYRNININIDDYRNNINMNIDECEDYVSWTG